MNQLEIDFNRAVKAPKQKAARAWQCEEPLERLDSKGAGALSDMELLAVLIGGGLRGNAAELAGELITEAGSLAALATWHAADFWRIEGIGRAKGFQLVSIVEMARRMIRGPEQAVPVLNTPQAIAAYLKPATLGLEVEKFWVICLNRKNRLRKLVEISSGSASSTLAPPMEIFRAAVREGASAIAVAHNHPSGDPAPSSADITVTRQLREASKHLDMSIVDHLIIGRTEADPAGQGFYSFRSAGLL